MNENRAPRVVVGVDDSLAGLQALRFAVAEARRRGVTLRAIRSWKVGTGWYGLDRVEDPDGLADAAAMMLVTAFRLAMGGTPADVVVEALVVQGPTARVLVEQADGADDLLVVGQSRHWPLRPSGVDVHCVRLATCPVVTVPPPALARGFAGRRSDVVSAAEALLHEAEL